MNSGNQDMVAGMGLGISVAGEAAKAKAADAAESAKSKQKVATSKLEKVATEAMRSEHLSKTEQPAPQAKKPNLVTLDQKELLEIELLATKSKLAETEERLLLIQIKNSRESRQQIKIQEAALLDRISKQLGIPPGKSIRLVDREKRLCQIEE